MFINELESLLEVPRAKIFCLEKELDLHPQEVKTHSVISFLFSDEEDKRIIQHFKAIEEKTRKQKQLEAEERARLFAERLSQMKEEHPLVTDDRCFKLSWWPDTTPDCFKDLENENRA